MGNRAELSADVRRLSGSTHLEQAKRRFDEGIIRIGGVAAIPAMLHELGVAPEQLLAEVGFDLALFDDPENMIPFASLGRLLAVCVARTGCTHFGLLLGQRGSTADLGLIGFLAQNSPDVESALRSLVRYLHHHDRGAVPTLARQGDAAILGYAIYQPHVEAAEQITDGALAIACNIMRRLCGPDWQARRVLFAHRAPGDSAPFRSFFRAPLCFDAGQNALVSLPSGSGDPWQRPTRTCAVCCSSRSTKSRSKPRGLSAPGAARPAHRPADAPGGSRPGRNALRCMRAP